MIKEIVKDNFILSQVCQDATKEDLYIVDDLLDTIKFHQTHCVGMAANMIGYLKNIIVVENQNEYLILINPVIEKETGTYQCEESCLSHTGAKQTQRYHKIKVSYLDVQFKKKIKTFEGFTAQIIQHEIDHCKGILI
ncbi:peptide deformylase [Erysipelatoclostridium sp. AM42-17]|uniref:peptide deformylase n=1 Tax=Erysipelatoclostridium sp. AM42-17 TaxID=2293102 RepID=UPI000E4E4DBB|nr:peptide deformylase [Erysipelatoclostridium sp. AM42-17]RHS93769.1 peptide deformylase [Erysipelatoclostridium sp. AM42-17]